MGSAEIIDRVEKIDEQVHDMKRMLLGGNQTRTEWQNQRQETG